MNLKAVEAHAPQPPLTKRKVFMYQKTDLPNGLRVVSYEMKDRDSISIGIWINAGGRYEEDKVKGAAHFLEHILFKGTKNYSCEAIKELIEGVGGMLNAFTSEENTCYFAKVPAKHLNQTFDVLADMVLSPLITKEDVDKERGVILEEIKMYHDLPQHFVLELLDELVWPDHPLGKNLAGSFETVGQMSEKDLQGFHRGQYISKNIVVAACGKFKHKDLLKLVTRKFRNQAKKQTESFLKFENRQNSPQVKLFRKDIEQMHLALGMHGLPYDHKDKYILNLLHVILGANMSSRLFDEVREKRGLAYAIGSSVKSLQDTGLFMVRAGVDNKKIVEAVKVILEELSKIKKENVTKDEFTRAKDYYLGQILLGLEDTLEHMLWLGESVTALNKTRTLKDILKEVKKIEISDIRRVAGQILNENHFNLSVVGPLAESQEKDLRRLVGVSGS
ncbi:MAG: pitrilysin family protein [Candidatus Omnitrophota bacterium]